MLLKRGLSDFMGEYVNSLSIFGHILGIFWLREYRRSCIDKSDESVALGIFMSSQTNESEDDTCASIHYNMEGFYVYAMICWVALIAVRSSEVFLLH